MSRALPQSFNFEVAKNTEYGANKMLRWFDKYIKLNPPPVDPRSQIDGIHRIKGGINELVLLDRRVMAKYIATFLRRFKPDMFAEPCDLIAECMDDKDSYRPPKGTLKFYKPDSYRTSVSALLSGLNRRIIKIHGKKMYEQENVNTVKVPNLINVDNREWILVKQVRDKVKSILHCHQIHLKLSRINKETNTLSVRNVCRIFQNLHKLVNGTPKV